MIYRAQALCFSIGLYIEFKGVVGSRTIGSGSELPDTVPREMELQSVGKHVSWFYVFLYGVEAKYECCY